VKTIHKNGNFNKKQYTKENAIILMAFFCLKFLQNLQKNIANFVDLKQFL
jgi:hypothetical protein